jgi:hypothetical protein
MTSGALKNYGEMPHRWRNATLLKLHHGRRCARLAVGAVGARVRASRDGGAARAVHASGARGSHGELRKRPCGSAGIGCNRLPNG